MPEKKEKEVKEHKKKTPVKKASAPSRYTFAIGRRKTAQATVKVFGEGAGEIKVNERDMNDYFPTLAFQKAVLEPLDLLGALKKYNITAKTAGGGVMAQAQAVALAISRAMIVIDPNTRAVLKKQGFLSRDARKKERKKPGLKRARRAPQWQKR